MRRAIRSADAGVRFACACLCALLAASSWAGQAPVAEQPAAADAGKKAEVFEFVPGNRRDPFTVRLRPNLPKEPEEQKPGKSGTPGRTEKELEPTQVLEKKAKAEDAYAAAEKTFMALGPEGRPLEVVATCDRGLEVFTGIGNLGKYPELLEVREKLLDLRRAADRLQQRLAAERKFHDMGIRLTGIVSREKHSQAIVNSKPVSKGQVVAASDNNEVVVDEIRPDQVIFIFQGYRMKLSLSDMQSAR
ncbi:MAG: hypothetical protein NTW87_10605 [Planctomycetota bacterium]|nr:hypothetical protein [Planctomycetota bacterium]